jgi:hypothetical protein
VLKHCLGALFAPFFFLPFNSVILAGSARSWPGTAIDRVTIISVDVSQRPYVLDSPAGARNSASALIWLALQTISEGNRKALRRA